MLAVPVFHPLDQNKLRPSPWGTIGVVRFSSSSRACEISRFLSKIPSREDRRAVTVLRTLADAYVQKMIAALAETGPSGGEKDLALD